MCESDFTRSSSFSPLSLFLSPFSTSLSFAIETHFEKHIVRNLRRKILLLNVDACELQLESVEQADRSVSMILEEASDENDENDEVASAGSRPARKLQAVAVKVLHPGIKGQLKYLL